MLLNVLGKVVLLHCLAFFENLKLYVALPRCRAYCIFSVFLFVLICFFLPYWREVFLRDSLAVCLHVLPQRLGSSDFKAISARTQS